MKTKDLPVISPDAEPKAAADGALIGEDPVRTDEVRKRQDAADAQALLEKQQAEIQRTIDESMSKYQNAMQSTISEIMNGVPTKKKVRLNNDGN